MVQRGRVCVIGGGLAGLSAAYDLGHKGFDVVILEAATSLGGLASSLIIEGYPVERFYHFICASDEDLRDLVGELGLQDKLHWQLSRTKFFYNGKMYDFGSPIDLLLFSAVPLIQRIRFGVNVISSRYRRTWLELDKISAQTWLKRQIGDIAYKVIWDPLLRVKFGEYHDQVSAAWIWHRINRVASSRQHIWEYEHFGYLEHGSQTVISELTNRLSQMPNVTVQTSARVKQIHTTDGRVRSVELIDDGVMIPCSAIVSTVALPVLLKLVPSFEQDYRQQLEKIDYLGVICGLLRLKQPLTNSFWVNINDSRIPFSGFIEYTNLNKHIDLGGGSLVYVPYYLPTSHPRFGYDDEQLLSEFIDGLRLINPLFNDSWVEEFHISRAAYVQAVCHVGFADDVPTHDTPINGLYITDSTQFYPEDRTISAAIRLGRRAARMIAEAILDDA